MLFAPLCICLMLCFRADGWVKDSFQRTVKMSTYLLAMIICDFDYIEQNTTSNVSDTDSQTHIIHNYPKAGLNLIGNCPSINKSVCENSLLLFSMFCEPIISMSVNK